MGTLQSYLKTVHKRNSQRQYKLQRRYLQLQFHSRLELMDIEGHWRRPRLLNFWYCYKLRKVRQLPVALIIFAYFLDTEALLPISRLEFCLFCLSTKSS